MPREIFVFGSNLAGIHGAGSALHARIRYGAEIGVGEGRTGMAYGIPTKDRRLRPRALTQVELSVDRFIRYASDHKDLQFLIVKIGCGLAGFSEEQIAPMFQEAPVNCILPKGWRT